MKTVRSDKAPAPIGPYSQAIETDSLLFISGCLGADPTSGDLREGIEAQSRQALDNLLGILQECSLSLNNVVKTTVYLKSMNDFARFNGIYASYFNGGHYPARTCVEISALPKGGLIEIEAIASKD